METGMIVEKQELFFLLSCKGCKRCPSLFRPKEQKKPEEILEGLFRKGWLSNTGKRFRVEKSLAEAVRQITEAEGLLCLCHGNRERELLYLYPGQEILAVQEMFPRRSALRLLYVGREGLRLFLEEQGFLGEDPRWEPMPWGEGAAPVLPKQLEHRSGLEAYPWIRLLVELVDGQSGQPTGRIGIVQAGFRDEIVTEDADGNHVSRRPYRTGAFMEMLLENL